MKILSVKRFLVLILLCLGINFNGFTQMKAEPQPFPLNDYKITFYEVQMNAETVKITEMDGSKITGIEPKIIIDKSTDSFTLDFTNCTKGQYLISGNRDELELEYTVER